MKKTILSLLSLLIFTCVASFSLERAVVSIVFTNKNEQYVQAVEGFKKFLKENNINLWFSEYNLEGKEEKGGIILSEIKNKKPDIIVAVGTLAAKIVSKNINDIPVVFCMVMSETSIEKKPNITGVLMDIPLEIKFDYLKKVLPKAKSIGVVYTSNTEKTFEEMLTLSKEKGYKIIGKKINSEKEFPEALSDLLSQIDIFWMIADSNIYSIYSVKHLILECFKNKVPLFGLSLAYTKAGALLSLDCNYEDMGKQAGEIGLKIIQSIKPENIPVEVPRKAELSINLIAAQKMGIEISKEILKETKEILKDENSN